MGRAAALLRAGAILAYPTETFYGLGALWSNATALERLAAAKLRPPGKPVPLLAADHRRLSALFTGDGGELAGLSRRMTARGRDMAVYEVNLHTLGGNAGPAERDGVTAGAASGSAQARTILEAFALGARRQAVWALAGYDMFTADRRGFVKLFGITRDLGATRRVRPTGLAVSMLNRALPGDLHAPRATREPPGLTALAARGAAGWSAMLVNASSETRAVDLLFPAASRTPLPGRVFRLDAAQPEATNEDEEAVRVVESALPPGGARISVRRRGGTGAGCRALEQRAPRSRRSADPGGESSSRPCWACGR